MKNGKMLFWDIFLWDQITKTIDLVLFHNVLVVAIVFFSSVLIRKYAQKSKWVET